MIAGPALLLTLLAIVVAWRGWRMRRRGPVLLAAMVSAAATAWWCRGYGAQIGLSLAIETGSMVALGFVLTRIEVRPFRAPKPRDVADAPVSSSGRLLGLARLVIAGPIALGAALGLAIAVTLPMAAQTRLVLVLLLVPSLWAAFVIWAMATGRPGRTAGGLVAIGAAGFALALLPRG